MLGNSEEKICTCYSSHLGKCTNVLMEQFLQEGVSLRHLLNEKLSLSLDGEVNDWAHRLNQGKISHLHHQTCLNSKIIFFKVEHAKSECKFFFLGLTDYYIYICRQML